MTADLDHVLMPPDSDQDHQELDAFARLVASADPELLAAGQPALPLPRAVQEALQHVVAALQAGRAVSIGPLSTLLTTQQAADLLGVTRPTVIKLLDDGRLPYERPGSHRRIHLADVLTYRAQRRTQRTQGLTDLIQHDEDTGLYDDVR